MGFEIINELNGMLVIIACLPCSIFCGRPTPNYIKWLRGINELCNELRIKLKCIAMFDCNQMYSEPEDQTLDNLNWEPERSDLRRRNWSQHRIWVIRKATTKYVWNLSNQRQSWRCFAFFVLFFVIHVERQIGWLILKQSHFVKCFVNPIALG